MQPRVALEEIAALGARGACGDGERRAACFARDQLRASGYDARLETLWLRPAWVWSYVLHAGAAVLGSLLCTWQPGFGLALLLAVLISFAGELSGRWHPLRLLAPLRATQNVVTTPDAGADGVRLIISANLDAGRSGAFAGWVPRSRLGALPLALLWAAIAVLCLVAALRLDGRSGSALDAVQFVLTLSAIVAFATLADIANGRYSPGANANASGVAVALALAAELASADFAALGAVQVVLGGAGDREALGFDRHLRSRRKQLNADNTVVLALEPCGGGTPVWWEGTGLLVPIRLHPGLCALMGAETSRRRHLPGLGAAYAAQRRGLPAIALGALGPGDRAPHMHQSSDLIANIDDESLAQTLASCRNFVAALDAELAGRRSAAPVPA